MVDKETIRPIYSELQGYLFKAPDKNDICDIYEVALWNQVNKAIDELNSISSDDYSRFKMNPVVDSHLGTPHLGKSTYSSDLAGLIAKLHGKYFSDEQAPFGGMPTTVISQTQQQSQSFQIELLLQVQSKIDEQIHNLEPRDHKRSFLEKVKGVLKSVRSAPELITVLLETAKEFGLSLEQLSELFK